MAKYLRYLATGFVCLDQIVPPKGLRTGIVENAITVAKGDILHNNAGYLTNAVTTFSHELKGVCVSAVVGDGALTVQYIPFEAGYQFIAPVTNDAVMVQTDAGVLIGLHTCRALDNSAAVTAVPGFMVDEIDISTAALAVATFGYGIGHFQIDS